MLGPLFADTSAIVSNNDTLQPSQSVPFKFDGGAFCVRVECIPYKFRDGFDMVAGTCHLLQVVMFRFEGEYDHDDSGQGPKKPVCCGMRKAEDFECASKPLS